MRTYSLFTDESGVFVGRKAIGRRVIVALALPGERARLEAGILPRLEEAVGQLGMPAHATDFRRPGAVAQRLRARMREGHALAISGRLQRWLAAGRPVPSVSDATEEGRSILVDLEQIGARALDAVTAIAAEQVAAGGMVLICLEHGAIPDQDRWHPMMRAVVGEACLRLVLANGSCQVHLVLAERSSPAKFDLAPLVESLDRARRRVPALGQLSILPSANVDTVCAVDSVGIQLADVFANRFGPGGRACVPVPLERRQLSLLQLRWHARAQFCINETCCDASGALATTHGEVMGALVDLGIGPLGAERARRLRTACYRLPDHTYRCSVAGSLDVVETLGRQG